MAVDDRPAVVDEQPGQPGTRYTSTWWEHEANYRELAMDYQANHNPV